MPENAVVLGVGMTAWGKWGRPFVDYGVAAARDALDDAGVDWADIDLIVGGETVRNGYAGYVAGSTVAAALGFNGAQVATVYGACASGAMAIDHGRAHIMAGLADVVLVVGADTTPKGFLAPNAGERPDDPDWLRFRLLGATNPAYFGLYARRRMHLYGATESDFAKVKVKNSRHGVDNPRARYRKEVAEEEVLASPIVASPLHLLDICATSDGAAAVVLCSADYAARQAGRAHDRTGGRPTVHIAAVSVVTPAFPDTGLGLPDLATDSSAPAGTPRTPGPVLPPRPPRSFRDSIAHTAYEQAGIGPEDVDVAEVYDLSTALELDWYENLGLCAPGEAEQLIRRGATALGGAATTVNPSGGLACFGEAVPAQAIAQVCELVWQLRGDALGRQVEGARVGISANQGLFGHGSSVIVQR
ncbi:MAG TPA: lipid-transfer protein [Acidimicrobiia bacterium]|nr:lipid-transfer protein [Acidimicrobiia bacterium]